MDEKDTQNNTQTPSATPTQPKADASDIEKNKALAVVGYIIPILFFVPLLNESKNSPFAKFHANQQLNLLLFGVAGWVASMVLAVVLIGFLIAPLVGIASLVFMIMGIINAVNGEMKQLPLIGQFTLLK